MDEPITSDMLDALPDIDLDLDLGIDGGGRANQRVVVAMSGGWTVRLPPLWSSARAMKRSALRFSFTITARPFAQRCVLCRSGYS